MLPAHPPPFFCQSCTDPPRLYFPSQMLCLVVFSGKNVWLVLSWDSLHLVFLVLILTEFPFFPDSVALDCVAPTQL